MEKRSASSNRRGVLEKPSTPLWVLGVLVVLGIGAMYVVESAVRYASTISDAKRTASSYANIISEHTARTFETINRTLMAAAALRDDADTGRKILTQDIRLAGLRDLFKSAPAILAIGWTDSAGRIVESSHDFDLPQQDISELPYFRTQRDGGRSGLYIGPLFRGKSGKWISSASLRLNNPDGNFAGVVTALLELDYFSNIFRMVELGSNDAVTLINADGDVLTREPFLESVVGQSLHNTALFEKYLKQFDAGVYESKSPLDGKDRILAYRAVTGLPLILVVSADRDQLLAQWNYRVRIAALFIGFLSAAVLFGTFILARRSNLLAQKTILLDATLENMHQGLIVVDQSDRIAVCNRQAMRLLDLPPELMSSKPLSAKVIAYQAARGEFEGVSDELKPRLQPRLVGETSHVYERVRPNGRILEIRTIPFADIGTIRTYRDITSRKFLENELKDRERQFRLIAENTTDVVARLNFSGRLLYVSPSSFHMLGYHPEELTGVNVTDFIHSEDTQPVVEFFGRFLNGNTRPSKTIEYRFLHKQEHWIWLEASPTLVLDEDGRPVEFVDVVRDVTARKAFEVEAEQSRQRAERAAAAQGQFLATMSHELRTPLNSIVGFADIVLDRRDLAPDTRRQLGLIQTAGDALLMVVNDILDFSKIAEGKMKLAPTDFRLAKLVDDCMSIVRGEAVAKQLNLTVSIDEKLSPFFHGDDHRLRQVLLNLLNNAIKFTNRGSVSLSIALTGKTGNAEDIRFSVLDTGIGISAENLPMLFQRFTQLDGTSSREFGGSGLGLAICKHLVDAMGGRIDVESVVGKGSTFQFMLSLPKRQRPQAKQGETPARATAARLLLVEDMEINREIARATLLTLGYQVETAADGAEAVASVNAGDYDLVLMDIQMPEMDGLTATRHIRNLPGPKSQIPIVAMTANVLPAQIVSFLEAGMNGHVGKPFRRDELVQAIEQCIGKTAIHQRGDQAAEETANSLETLISLLGPAKVDALLQRLQRQLEEFINCPGTTELAGLSRQAHNIVSSAGILGFSVLSENCAKLDEELRSDRFRADLLEGVRAICGQALAEISTRLGGASADRKHQAY